MLSAFPTDRLLVGGIFALGLSTQRVDAQSTLAPSLVNLLRDLKSADRDQLAVSEGDNHFLRAMVASNGAKHALTGDFDFVFVDATIQNHPMLLTTIVTPSGEGMSVSCKVEGKKVEGKTVKLDR